MSVCVRNVKYISFVKILFGNKIELITHKKYVFKLCFKISQFSLEINSKSVLSFM